MNSPSSAPEELHAEERIWRMWGWIVVGMVLVACAEWLGVKFATQGVNGFYEPAKAQAAALTFRLLGGMFFSIGLVDRLAFQLTRMRS